MSAAVNFKAKSGAEASGDLAAPDGTTKSPAVVLIHEYWGVNEHVKSVAARLADAGFLVLAPDLYHGKVATTADEAKKFVAELDRVRALDEIAGAVAFLASHPQSNGKVAVMGFCLGGAYAFSAACVVPGIAAVVPFYGLPSNAEYANVTAPIQAHFAKTDAWAKPELAEGIKKQLEAHGQPMELHVYEADHAFFNDTRPEAYNAVAAKLAWDRTLAFLRTHLA
jgi:carboxymethylenebutenolidase